MLFGHQNDDTTQPAETAPVTEEAGVNPLAVDPRTGASLPAPQLQTTVDPTEPSVLNQPPISVPASDDQADTATVTAPAVEPVTPFTADPAPVADVPAPATTSRAAADDNVVATPGNDNLLSLKQQALAQLGPLVGQLDQTPEERFRTTMMMIQSTDNQSLIQDAYDAAQAITDEKVRAQALLDVVNEINYFTQQKQ